MSASSDVNCSIAESWSAVAKGRVSENLCPDEVIVIKQFSSEMENCRCLAFQSVAGISVEKLDVQYQKIGELNSVIHPCIMGLAMTPFVPADLIVTLVKRIRINNMYCTWLSMIR